MNWIQTSLVVIIAVSYFSRAQAQSYFKISEATDLLDQKMAVFRNGDLLIGNSSTAPLQTGDEIGILLLKRIDNCGNPIWLRQYNYNDGYLELKDIAVNQNDEIFMYGSHYRSLTESIFISKIENASDDILDFRIFNPGSVDHFTYSLDLSNDKLLVYGLLLDFNSSKEGFIGIFDHNLNFQEARKFVPFESTGDVKFSNDGGVIARSGQYVYKFDDEINLDWAYTSKNQKELLNISGPFKTNNGWIFESHNNGLSFLYKLDGSGNLMWRSKEIEKINVGGDLEEMDNGNMLFAYNRERGSGSELLFLIIDQLGNTVQEKKLSHNYSMNTGELRLALQDEEISIIGSKNLFATGAIEVENFMLKFKLGEVLDDCYQIEESVNASPDNVSISFDKLDIVPEEFQLEMIDRIRLKSSSPIDDTNDLCNREQDIVPIVDSKLLPCIDVWNVSLPGDSYRWDDGYASINRELSDPGTYTARNIDCEEQEILEYRLEKEECGCHIYVPNIFSPNGDETNDKLNLGVFCSLESMDLSIFNRWGELIFESNSADQMWTGKVHQNDAPAGLYSVLLNYKWRDANGDLQEKKISQTITLMR